MTPREEMAHLRATSPEVQRYLRLAAIVRASGCSPKKAAALAKNAVLGGNQRRIAACRRREAAAKSKPVKAS